MVMEFETCEEKNITPSMAGKNADTVKYREYKIHLNLWLSWE